MDPGLIFIITSLVFSAFFSGIEIAFVTSNKLRIELQNKQGLLGGKILSQYVKDPSKFISTTLVGNNIALVIYGIFSGEMLDNTLLPLIPDTYWRFIIVTIITTLIVLITAEFLPKSLFRLNPDNILNALIIPFHLCYFILWPIVAIITFISKGIIKILTGENMASSKPVFNRLDLDNLISQTGQIELNEDSNLSTEMFKNALDFGNLKVRDCMIPRTELVAVDINENIKDLFQVFIESRHSKVLIFKENIDNIIGYVHQISLLKNPKTISEATMPILITNKSRSLQDQLKEMTLKRKSIAVVVDEFGGTAGIITIEDIIEEIFGEIDDEYDTEELKETIINDKHYIFSGRHTIEYLNENYNLSIPEGEYETLGGYIISISESIPDEKEVIVIDNFEITIKQMKAARIEEVELKVI
jgi:CBS domain containing-hemolysin-like protein